MIFSGRMRENVIVKADAVAGRQAVPVQSARGWPFLLSALLLAGLFQAGPARAADAPHNATNSMDCISCHLTHHTAGITISNAVGNVNLCHSCHTPGGLASRYALVESDQANAGPGLPTNVIASGTSHRWDSGLAGHIDYMGGAQTNASGTVSPSGDYTGRVAKTYVLTIVTNGQVGVAKFNWTGTQPGGGGASNVLANSLVALDQGISVVFSNGTLNPSFRTGDQWNLNVRSDISQPTNPLLLGRVSGGLLACSTCHNQHSETNTPFDSAAPTTPGASGRHFQRIDNNACQLCVECHAARNVTNAAAGSHPVGVTIPSNSLFKAPSFLPLEKTANKVRCLSCHDIHNSATSDGNLLRIANRNALCTDCHTLADTNQAAHLSLINGVLWPGGQYGTTYPQQTDAAQRGMCNNCHQPHGWPTNLTSSVDFTNLLVEARVTICLTCHDGSPAASTNSVIVDFTNTTKVARHAVRSSDPLRKASRPVDCTDCHNPHQARLGRSVYTNAVAMTSTRNLVVNPNVGVSGVVVNYALLANYAAPSTNIYTLTNSVVYEYQICFKCHSSYWSGWNTNSPPTGLSANGTVSTPIETDLVQSFNFNNRSGHPIVTGLNNFTNSYAPRNLATGSMKAPWAANVGTQTMLCTDCHNTDGNLAQGPHGSAAQFMLRGANAANWPNVDTANISTSWCVNCHNPNADIHTSGVHAGTVSGVAMRCYSCHIVIPHGGKMSRLIADRDGVMPVRYAYSNDKNNVQILQFKKISGTQSGDSQCNTACGDHLFSDPLSEDW